MKLILKYLKPFAFAAIVSIVLLFGQSGMELFLPRFMSDIVDTGIMKGGVKEPLPLAISGKSLAELNNAGLSGMIGKFEQAFERVSVAPDGFPDFNVETDYVVKPEVLEAARNAPPYGEPNMTYATYVSAIIILRTGEWRPELDFEKNGVLYSQMAAQYTRDLYEELGADKVAIQQKSILSIGLIMLAITLAGALITVGNGYLTAKISTGIGRKLRRDVFTKVQTFSPSEFDKFSTATLITRCTNDVQQVQMVSMMGLRMIVSAPIMGVGGVVMALNTSLQMSWVVAVAVLLLLLLQVAIFSRVTPKFEIMQKLADRLNLVTRETLTGMMVIRAFGNEEREYDRFETANRDIRNTNRFVQRVFAVMQPTMQFILGGVQLVILLLGSRLISANNLQVGQMMAFSQYVMQIIMSFMMIGMMFMMIPRALVSAKRLQEVLDSDTSIRDPEPDSVKTLEGHASGELTFNNVSFKYQDAEACVLENISFTAKAGETTAFIGSTGSGKSTLINLIPRFYDVTEGSITLDGIDIRELSVHELRENLGYVPQKGILFSGDIASNLSFGKED
ncbi:MAG: ABC transporter ATP-binding protein/permease, partial [Oscillospiraceae bacterium]|nr:ABC transporter ATP-binding protein/permease [Oscillospiraceae bacterium]